MTCRIKHKLQLTNGYYLHFDQVSRILQYAYDQMQRKKIPRTEFIDALGMTLKQFENLSSICVGLGLIKTRTLILTPLGKIISGQDIFFDNLATLWLLHYVISSEPKWIVWNRLINNVFHENESISTEIAKPYYEDLRESFSEQAVNKKLPKEILSVLDAYSEQKFYKLKLIKKVSTGKYERQECEVVESLPFIFCLIHYKEKLYPHSSAIVINEIMKAENSPGRVLCLDDYSIENILTSLHDQNLLRIETVGDLEQVRFNENITKSEVLESIYKADL